MSANHFCKRGLAGLTCLGSELACSTMTADEKAVLDGRLPARVKLHVVASAPSKADCPGHVAGRDSIGRYPIGDCGPDCVLRRYRLGVAEVVDGRWV